MSPENLILVELSYSLLIPTGPSVGLSVASGVRGLGSDLTSFNFKLLHKLLVTKSQLHDLNPIVH